MQRCIVTYRSLFLWKNPQNFHSPNTNGYCMNDKSQNRVRISTTCDMCLTLILVQYDIGHDFGYSACPFYFSGLTAAWVSLRFMLWRLCDFCYSTWLLLLLFCSRFLLHNGRETSPFESSCMNYPAFIRSFGRACPQSRRALRAAGAIGGCLAACSSPQMSTLEQPSL